MTNNLDRLQISFDSSAAAFVAECFGLRVVDGKLKRQFEGGFNDVKCLACESIIKEPTDIGGFFNRGESVDICCKDIFCLVEAGALE